MQMALHSREDIADASLLQNSLPVHLEDTILNLDFVCCSLWIFICSPELHSCSGLGGEGDKLIASEKKPSFLVVCGNKYLTVYSEKQRDVTYDSAAKWGWKTTCCIRGCSEVICKSH